MIVDQYLVSWPLCSLSHEYKMIICFSVFFIGVKKLKDFQVDFAELEKERQELVNAEKLFDLHHPIL